MLSFDDLFYKKFQDDSFFKSETPLIALRMHNNLLAITCLLLASKFYEIDDNLVMSSDV